MLKTTFDVTTKALLKEAAKSKLVFKCSKHPRYNPAHGGGKIVGNCAGCRETLEGYEAIFHLRTALSVYVAKTARFETAKPRKKKVSTASSPKLDSALNYILHSGHV